MSAPGAGRVNSSPDAQGGHSGGSGGSVAGQQGRRSKSRVKKGSGSSRVLDEQVQFNIQTDLDIRWEVLISYPVASSPVHYFSAKSIVESVPTSNKHVQQDLSPTPNHLYPYVDYEPPPRPRIFCTISSN